MSVHDAEKRDIGIMMTFFILERRKVQAADAFFAIEFRGPQQDDEILDLSKLGLLFRAQLARIHIEGKLD